MHIYVPFNLLYDGYTMVYGPPNFQSNPLLFEFYRLAYFVFFRHIYTIIILSYSFFIPSRCHMSIVRGAPVGWWLVGVWCYPQKTLGIIRIYELGILFLTSQYLLRLSNNLPMIPFFYDITPNQYQYTS